MYMYHYSFHISRLEGKAAAARTGTPGTTERWARSESGDGLMGDDSARLPPIDGVGATVEADVTVSRTSLRWADGRVVARDSPRLSRALRATGWVGEPAR